MDLSRIVNGVAIEVGRGAHIHVFEFTEHKNKRFQKTLIMQNMSIRIFAPHPNHKFVMPLVLLIVI